MKILWNEIQTTLAECARRIEDAHMFIGYEASGETITRVKDEMRDAELMLRRLMNGLPRDNADA